MDSRGLERKQIPHFVRDDNPSKVMTTLKNYMKRSGLSVIGKGGGCDGENRPGPRVIATAGCSALRGEKQIPHFVRDDKQEGSRDAAVKSRSSQAPQASCVGFRDR